MMDGETLVKYDALLAEFAEKLQDLWLNFICVAPYMSPGYNKLVKIIRDVSCATKAETVIRKLKFFLHAHKTHLFRPWIGSHYDEPLAKLKESMEKCYCTLDEKPEPLTYSNGRDIVDIRIKLKITTVAHRVLRVTESLDYVHKTAISKTLDTVKAEAQVKEAAAKEAASGNGFATALDDSFSSCLEENADHASVKNAIEAATTAVTNASSAAAAAEDAATSAKKAVGNSASSSKALREAASRATQAAEAARAAAATAIEAAAAASALLSPMENKENPRTNKRSGPDSIADAMTWDDLTDFFCRRSPHPSPSPSQSSGRGSPSNKRPRGPVLRERRDGKARVSKRVFK